MSVERLTALLAALAPRRLGDIVLHDLDGPSRVVRALPGSRVSCFQTAYEFFFGSVRESKLIRSMICVSLTGLLTYA